MPIIGLMTPGACHDHATAQENLLRTSNFSRNHEQQRAHADKLHLSRYPAIHTGLVQMGYRGFGGVGWQWQFFTLKMATEPQAVIAFLNSAGIEYARIGLKAGPLSQWLVNGLTKAELPVICVEIRHMKAVLKVQQVNRRERNDARGIAQMMRVGLYKPVSVKTLASQQMRMLLTSRKLLCDKLQDMENELRGTLRNFGLKIGVVSPGHFEARIKELVAGPPPLKMIIAPFIFQHLKSRIITGFLQFVTQ